ncbi:MAG: serine/threonine-protein kinase KIN2 [Candelina mexicana]|nr:MAG: serine/threonine-protein kinase KIN2 [Candelina mexicana]
MSATSSASPAVVRSHSSSRRQQSSTSSSAERPQRAHSTKTRPAATSRSDSQSNSHSRPPPASQQAALANVARRDYETTSVARPPSSRRSLSRDESHDPPPTPGRTDSTRSTHRTSSRPGHLRYSSDMSAAPAVVANGASTLVRAAAATAERVDKPIPSSSGSTKRRTTISAQTGQWGLGKTIGAGSMGKVKLAKNLDNGEQVAVKIVPRQSTDDHQNNRERERADHSKEVRTAREAAIVTLLNHPYICAMRDVVRTNYHWYMLFEYVNGGQMLDYIISHGRLKEKQARKFGRQIASALDYCHRNSIVHRDLKIENILISKTGDIKIIDFGLSNLFSPKNHLKTFCGSLYFAAPELLQARQYTGPEVDIWSFGIVLYVLVCGKVPFDDQSMPKLHAKIKQGIVDYPQWLSSECRSLISRMLVTDPRQRATLTEIMNHPWIIKGFNSSPENYLPHREPLQLPLDPKVIEKMTGFDFGSTEYITTELTKILESEVYQQAVRLAGREQFSHNHASEKRRGVFDFYKRRSSTTSGDTLINSSAEAVQLGTDPVNAFSPLISIYYLAREKQERERIEPNPGALSIPRSPGEKPLKIPDLPAPEAAHTNDTTYEMPGERATGGRSRPRSRTHGEEEVTEGMKKLNLGAPGGPPSPAVMTPPSDHPPARKENTAVGLLRRLSTRRHRDSDRDRVSNQPTPSLSVQAPSDLAAPSRKSFSVRRTRNRDPSPATFLHPGGSQPQHQDLLSPPGTADSTSKASKGLGRSTSVNSADIRRRGTRRGVSEGQNVVVSNDPPLTSGSDRSSTSGIRPAAEESASVDPNSTGNPRSATLRTRSLGHARRESIQTRRARRDETREANVPEETDVELAGNGALDQKIDETESMKPVFLKGLFSVSTTSTKPLPVIRGDIIRVLRQLGVEYNEIRGGFSCRHAPSIDLNRVVDNGPPSPDRQGMVQGSSHRRRISFFGGDRDEIREHDRLPHTPRTPSRKDPSFTNSEDSDESVRRHGTAARVAGETTTHVESELGGSMVLKFEIFIVKVPLFSLHGVQFKKVAGGTWQYKNMAQKILNELRL